MSNKEIFDTFMEKGGTELAPMSTTAELWVSLQYALGQCGRQAGNINTLLWLRTENFMDRGVDLEWLSALPHEKEYLYPPLSFPPEVGQVLLELGILGLKIWFSGV